MYDAAPTVNAGNRMCQPMTQANWICEEAADRASPEPSLPAINQHSPDSQVSAIEAMRDLVRARPDAVHSLRRARQQLSGFICARAAITGGRPGPSCIAGGSPGSNSSRRCIIWSRGLRSGGRGRGSAARSATAQIAAMLPDWTLAPVVAALQTMRGMALVNAATLIAELGDLARFANPRQLMAYLGLVPSEHSSGASATTPQQNQAAPHGRAGRPGAGSARRRDFPRRYPAAPALSTPGSLLQRPYQCPLCGPVARQPLGLVIGAVDGPARNQPIGRREARLQRGHRRKSEDAATSALPTTGPGSRKKTMSPTRSPAARL